MCRLFGQHAHAGFDATEPLCTAENALRFQSHKHPHGWGIGWYVGGAPHVRRGILPAHADDAFAEAGRALRSTVVLAHVREASVGPVLHENTHPFSHDRWLFAHNGTVARFKDHPEVRAAIQAEIDPDLRLSIRGDTDSERCFFLFLTRLRAHASLAAATLADVRRALRETTAAVLGIADAVPVPKPSSLNFLVSDGRLLAACRRGRTLHAAADTGPRHAFVVASERIGRAGWGEVPEGGFVGTEDGTRIVEDLLEA
ncbi:MAG: class II glutamine amidotransferase [Anaeromyxobacter sp.]